MQKSSFDLEKKLFSEGYDFVVGIDEAGRGPLAGPVVASAVCLKSRCHCERSEAISSEDIKSGIAAVVRRGGLPRNDKLFDLIRDSKTLSHKQREDVFDFIHEHFFVGVGICDHATIDRVNILEATYLAAKKAINALTRSMERGAQNDTRYALRDTRTIILFDGNKVIPNLSMEQRAIVNGDKLVKSISAASIVAKVTRDKIMLEMHQKYPEYGFDKHKGYGTKLHMDALQKHGACPIHRRSFAPVKLAKRLP